MTSICLLTVLVLLCYKVDGFVVNSHTADNWQSADPTLLQVCQPVSKPANGRVYCTYSSVDLTCKATCDAGYHFDDNALQKGLYCSKERVWLSGTEFPKCLRDSVCVQDLTYCVGRLDGDYPSCKGCNHYVTCSRDGISERLCPEGLKFDNNKKQCLFQSTTCI